MQFLFNNNLVFKFLSLLLSLILVFSTISCNKEVINNVTIFPTKPLTDEKLDGKYSIISGNFHYKSFLSTDGTYIYYQSDNGKALEKSDYDGKNSMIISNRFPSYINVSNGFVYFIDGNGSGKVYKVDTNGKGETLIIDIIVKSLIVLDNYVLFIDAKDDTVHFCNKDGGSKTLLYKDPVSTIMVSESNLYLVNKKENNEIFSFEISKLKIFSKSTSSDFVKITDAKKGFDSYNFYNNKIYFVDTNNNSFINIYENNKTKSILKTTITMPFIISNDQLFYINKNDESRLYKFPLDKSKDSEVLINDRVHEFVVCGNSIYYRRENSLEIFRTTIDKVQSMKIT